MRSDREILISLLTKLEKRKQNGATERELGYLLEGLSIAYKDTPLSNNGLELIKRIYKELKANKAEKESVIEKYLVYCSIN